MFWVSYLSFKKEPWLTIDNVNEVVCKYMIENIKIILLFFFFYDDCHITLLVPQPSLIFVACFILPYSKKIFVMINGPCIKWLLNFIFISDKKC